MSPLFYQHLAFHSARDELCRRVSLGELVQHRGRKHAIGIIPLAQPTHDFATYMTLIDHGRLHNLRGLLGFRSHSTQREFLVTAPEQRDRLETYGIAVPILPQSLQSRAAERLKYLWHCLKT